MDHLHHHLKHQLYIDILGNTQTQQYELEPEDEGRMLFFPSQLNHAVYPFFNCDEERISVSGNVHDSAPLNNLANFAPEYLKNKEVA